MSANNKNVERRKNIEKVKYPRITSESTSPYYINTKQYLYTLNMIEVRYKGRLGNNLFQYCFGRILAESLGFTLKAEYIEGSLIPRQKYMEVITQGILLKFSADRM